MITLTNKILSNIDHPSYQVLFNDNAKLRQDINNFNTNTISLF